MSRGLAGFFAVVAAMEAGVPIPVPSDLVLLLVGERAAAGVFPLWAAVLAIELSVILGTSAIFLAARGPGSSVLARFGARIGLKERLARASSWLEGRGASAVIVGRAMPGLRTATAVAAGGSAMLPRRALLLLMVGSSIFVQAHVALGFIFGAAARELIEQNQGYLLLGVAALGVVGLLLWLLRRGRKGVTSWTEASCPACLALGVPFVASRFASNLEPES